MRPLPSDTRCAILAMLRDGQSCCSIAPKLHIGHSTVSELRSHLPSPSKPNTGGRPPKLTPHNQRYIVRLVTTGQADNAIQLKRVSGIDVCPQTIRNTLKKENLQAVVKAKKPRLLPCHIRQCYEFALKYKDWTEEDWHHVIFSDESKINRLGSDGRVWVWKKQEAPHTAQHVQGTVKFGGGSLMVWGCMTAEGVGFMCRIDVRMDAVLYQEILEDHLFQTIDYYGLDRDKFIFQQDGDSKHRSKLAMRWFKNNGVELLDWPAQSPDLNPIEHLWYHLKRRLGTYQEPLKSIMELWERVEEEWEKIPKQVCLDFINSMPRRLAAVFAAKGGYTKY